MGRKLKFCGVVSWIFGLSGQSVIGEYLRITKGLGLKNFGIDLKVGQPFGLGYYRGFLFQIYQRIC